LTVSLYLNCTDSHSVSQSKETLNALCAQNAEVSTVTAGSTHRTHCALTGQNISCKHSKGNVTFLCFK